MDLNEHLRKARLKATKAIKKKAQNHPDGISGYFRDLAKKSVEARSKNKPKPTA